MEVNELHVDNSKLNNTYLCMLVLKYGLEVEKYIRKINSIYPEFFDLSFVEKCSHIHFINEKILPYKFCISADYTTISLYDRFHKPSIFKIKNN